MVKDQEWVKYDRSGSETAPAAGTNIVGPLELRYEGRLLNLEIDSGEAAWFDVVVSDHDASNAVTKKKVRIPSDGHAVIEGDLEDFILDMQAQKEIKVQNSEDVSAGVDVAVTLRVAEKRA